MIRRHMGSGGGRDRRAGEGPPKQLAQRKRKGRDPGALLLSGVATYLQVKSNVTYSLSIVSGRRDKKPSRRARKAGHTAETAIFIFLAFSCDVGYIYSKWESLLKSNLPVGRYVGK